MKIYACSNWKLKFLGLLIDYWREQGHEVEYTMGYDPDLRNWSDVTFVDVCDHNAQVASRHVSASRLVIRAIDIECWAGQPGAVEWANVAGCIFGAKHIQELVEGYLTFPPNVTVQHIPFGINIEQWSFRRRERGTKVAVVTHRWLAKEIPMVLQIMGELGPDYSVHFLGTPSNEKFLHKYIDYMIAELGIEATFETWVDDLDAWLDDKDYLLSASIKETFSYVSAEAATKGLKPVIHNFYRATDIWPAEWLWNRPSEALSMITTNHYNSLSYRNHIRNHYSLAKMMGAINVICQIN